MVYFHPPITVGNFPLHNKWKLNLDEDVLSVTNVTDQPIVVIQTQKALYGLDQATGRLKWRTELINNGDSTSPKSFGGNIYAVGNQYAIALNQENGEIIWKTPLEISSGSKSTAVSDGHFFVNETSYIIFAFDRQNGNLSWQIPTLRGISEIHVNHQVVYVINDGIYQYDEGTGKPLTEYNAPGYFSSDFRRPFLCFLHTEDAYAIKEIECDNVEKNQILWKQSLEGSGFPLLKILENEILISMHSELFFLNLTTGEIVWSKEAKGVNNISFIDNVIYAFESGSRKILALTEEGTELGYIKTAPSLLLTYDQEIMTSSDDELIFAVGNKVYVYGK